ncbi:GLPGLI family protein [Tenacibaculum sp. IB213877]|uniref:GLPGLI family protein n=1 Tax=Tenacibaculum sp. IB213877 TaxID=3097351 RepID=UPI002A5AD6F3|nr:GLPGLI family protein [Tenacibaculum sp. IB213877]MDY0781600.1 GLPGLI family protein [Tenacibaculum sp. IB213877]
MKSIVTLVFAFCSVVTFAQKNFQGKAVYQSKTSFDMSRFEGREMSEQRKKQIMERMKNMLEKTYVLTFNKTSSIYKEEEKLEAPGQGRGFRFGGFTEGIQYKNTSDKKLLEEREMFGKKFLISEEPELPQWEMTAETKQIGNYLCYKATMMKKTDAFDWRNMRRRDDNKPKDTTKTKEVVEGVEIPKEVLVTAWYTPQIPVSNGPGEYWGLPGLILEVNSDKTTILCTEVVLNPKEKIQIEAPTKGDKVTREEYNKIVKEKMEEMREMFRNRRGGERRGRF